MATGEENLLSSTRWAEHKTFSTTVAHSWDLLYMCLFYAQYVGIPKVLGDTTESFVDARIENTQKRQFLSRRDDLYVVFYFYAHL